MTIPSGIRNWSLHIILIWKTRLDDYIGSKYLHKINSVQSIHICIFLANSVPWNSQAKFLIYIWIILNFQKVDNMAKFLSVQLNRKNIRFNWFGTKIAKITIVDIYGMPICQSLCMDFLIPSSFFFFLLSMWNPWAETIKCSSINQKKPVLDQSSVQACIVLSMKCVLSSSVLFFYYSQDLLLLCVLCPAQSHRAKLKIDSPKISGVGWETNIKKWYYYDVCDIIVLLIPISI